MGSGDIAVIGLLIGSGVMVETPCLKLESIQGEYDLFPIGLALFGLATTSTEAQGLRQIAHGHPNSETNYPIDP